MIKYLILIISFILDGVLSNFIDYIPNNLSLFTPLLTLISIFLIYPFYKKDEENFYITLLILGLVYDLFYTNLLGFNSLMFVFIGSISKFIYKNLQVDFFKIILYLIIIIVLYESSTAIIFYVLKIVPITLDKVIYKISHSLILNVIYGEIVYLILKLLPEKYRKTMINEHL